MSSCHSSQNYYWIHLKSDSVHRLLLHSTKADCSFVENKNKFASSAERMPRLSDLLFFPLHRFAKTVFESNFHSLTMNFSKYLYFEAPPSLPTPDLPSQAYYLM
jgi:hypothetical protein